MSMLVRMRYAHVLLQIYSLILLSFANHLTQDSVQLNALVNLCVELI